MHGLVCVHIGKGRQQHNNVHDADITRQQDACAVYVFCSAPVHYTEMTLF